MNTENEIKDYGFIPSVIEEDHYLAGALPKDILQSDGDWTPYLPTYECQAINFETSACAFFGTINSMETIEKKLKGGDPNHSERFPYNIAGAIPSSGNDPHTVAEIIRKNGMVDQSVLPMTKTIQEWMTPRPMTLELIDKGEEWLNQYDFKHEWIFTNNPKKEDRVALLKEYLKYSPVAMSVTAWHRAGDEYVDHGQPNTHWVMCFKLEEVDGEYFPIIFDSYTQNGSPIKRLHPDHHIEMAKRYTLGPSTHQATLNRFQIWINQIQAMIEQLKRQLNYVGGLLANRKTS